MIILVISGSDERFQIISSHIKPMGFEVVHYSYVQKALDNLAEINPRAIIVNAQDFPRHWKVVVQFVRSEKSKEACPIYLFTGPDFPTEEKSKASFLGVNRQLDENIENWNEIEDFFERLSRNILPGERRKYSRLVVEPWHRFNFMFVNPNEKKVVTGDLLTISVLTRNIAPNTEVAECSMRIGGSVYSPVCRIVNISDTVSIEFISFPENGKRKLVKYLKGFSA